MGLLPIQNETIVSSLQAEEVVQLIRSVTSPPTLDKNEIAVNSEFIGTVEGFTFKLSKRLKVPENFCPIILGQVDSTSLGSILHLRFRLFFSSQLFLTFWSIISITAFALFLFLFNEIIYAGLALVVGLLNYTVSVISFKKKVNESHEQLLDVLKMDK